MSSLFDENNEEERQEQKLYEFYEVFSLDVRRRLLAKNLPIIQNVYDVLYPQTKNQLLEKNQPSDITIDSNADSIRNSLVKKLVEDNINIDNISERIRKQLLSKNKLASSAVDLQKKINSIRDGMLKRNNPTNYDGIDEIANKQRRESLSRNKEQLNQQSDLDRRNDSFRVDNLNKNTTSQINIDSQSLDYRDNNINKNVSNQSDLSQNSEKSRDNNLAKNVKSPINEQTTSSFDVLSDKKRKELESKNVTKPNEGLEIESKDFRLNNTFKNTSQNGSTLDESSDAARESNLSKNENGVGDLLNDSNSFRKDDLAKNNSSTSDLLESSQIKREDDLAKNRTSNNSNLLDLNEDNRLDDLAKNVSSEGDLLTDSEQSRQEGLSKNSTSNGDLFLDSQVTRFDNLKNNTPNDIDIDRDNKSFREDQLGRNQNLQSNLEEDSAQFRAEDLSKNTINQSDLLVNSNAFRESDLSNNVQSVGDLLEDSQESRKNILSKNVQNEINLDELGSISRINLLNANVASNLDLLRDSEKPRGVLIAKNTPSISDLLIDSETTRDSVVSSNVPRATDLLTDSDKTRDDVLKFNVPSFSDLLNDSFAFYLDNMVANAPSPYDILTSSQYYLNQNLANNIPINSDLLIDSYPYLQDDLSSNVPNNSDLLTDSAYYLQTNINSNVPIFSDLIVDSLPIKDGLLASNQPSNSDLLTDSETFRDNQLALNPNNNLGITFDALGSFSYLGLSVVGIQGLVFRSFLLTRNQPNPQMSFSSNNPSDYQSAFFFNPNSLNGVKLLGQNDYVYGSSEYVRGVNSNTLTTRRDLDNIALPAIVNLFTNDTTIEKSQDRQIKENFNFSNISTALQDKYGVTTENNYQKNSIIGGGFYYTKIDNAQGGYWQTQGAVYQSQVVTSYHKGNITEAIRNYNLSRNLYNSQKIEPVTSMASFKGDIDANNDLGFQDLIEKTIGSFKTANQSISAQQFGNLVPSVDVYESNGGYQYLNGSAEDLIRSEGGIGPSQKDSWLKTAPSMMAKLTAGNPLTNTNFEEAKRGVKYIMKTIRSASDTIPLAGNYYPQGQDNQVGAKFLIGQKGNQKVYSQQRYTIKNPYAPPSAKALTFSLKNYSNGTQVYFPAYIQDFSDSHTANWNEINFLGRPEPIYTYNNSKRDGTISFYVLTDYGDEVVLGRDWNNPNEKVSRKITKGFYNSTSFNVALQDFGASDLLKEIDDKKTDLLQNLNFDTANSNGEQGETADKKGLYEQLAGEKLELGSKLDSKISTENLAYLYNNVSKQNNNVYDFMTSTSSKENGEIDSKAENSIKRLDAMIQNLTFQPSYFSGSKTDFANRMDFLAKLTKPAKASEGSGYSFTKPPVAHIRLGDWWDHDIVVKTVSVDYTDAPWTLDLGNVQPLWAKVTLSFDFVGRYGGEGSPVLSTDVGGVYFSGKKTEEIEKKKRLSRKEKKEAITQAGNDELERQRLAADKQLEEEFDAAAAELERLEQDKQRLANVVSQNIGLDGKPELENPLGPPLNTSILSNNNI